MTRLAQAAQQMLSTDPAGVPHVSGGPNIAPQMIPEDPDLFDASFNPPNSRDDVVHVMRERAVVPSLPSGSALGTPATYAFKLGRANTALDGVTGAPVNLAVSAVSELTALPTAPSRPCLLAASSCSPTAPSTPTRRQTCHRTE